MRARRGLDAVDDGHHAACPTSKAEPRRCKSLMTTAMRRHDFPGVAECPGIAFDAETCIRWTELRKPWRTRLTAHRQNSGRARCFCRSMIVMTHGPANGARRLFLVVEAADAGQRRDVTHDLLTSALIAPSDSSIPRAVLTFVRLAPTRRASRSVKSAGQESFLGLARGAFWLTAARKKRASGASIGCDAMASSRSSASRSSPAKKRTAASPTAGRAPISRRKAAFESISVPTSSTAVVSADLGLPSNTANSPNIEAPRAWAIESSRPSEVSTESRTRPS